MFNSNPWIRRLRQAIAAHEYRRDTARGSSSSLMMITVHYEAEVEATRNGWAFEKLPYEHAAWGLM